jgi:hypothetical protein
MLREKDLDIVLVACLAPIIHRPVVPAPDI